MTIVNIYRSICIGHNFGCGRFFALVINRDPFLISKLMIMSGNRQSLRNTIVAVLLKSLIRHCSIVHIDCTYCIIVIKPANDTIKSLQRCPYERDGVSNHQPYDCLHNHLFRRRSKKTSKLRITGLCDGNSPVTSEFATQRASNAENVSI